MTEQKPNVEPLKWVTAATGEARHHRANIVMWRNSISLLHDLLARHFSISLQVDPPMETEPMRILTSKRLVMTEMVSLHARLEEWCAWLHATGLDCSGMDVVLDEHKLGLERVIEWDAVTRFGGITQEPDAVLTSYTMLEEVTFADINAVATALTAVGKAAEGVALNGAG